MLCTENVKKFEVVYEKFIRKMYDAIHSFYSFYAHDCLVCWRQSQFTCKYLITYLLKRTKDDVISMYTDVVSSRADDNCCQVYGGCRTNVRK
jgi:hypothetical protein